MIGDDLLLWLSARGTGSWPQFRAAVERLHIDQSDDKCDAESFEFGSGDLPVYQHVRLGLQRLGHVEFFSSTADADWRIVPASLAICRADDRCLGILCGARVPNTRERLDETVGAASWSTVEQSAGLPVCIQVQARTADELSRTAELLSLLPQVDAPEALIAAVPPVDDPRSRAPSIPPATPGWDIHRFSASSLRWESSDDVEMNLARTGLFRLRMQFQRFYFLKWRRRFFSTHVQVGKYAVLHDRRVRDLVRYCPRESSLSVPLICRPPMLVERALVLCSGCLPTVDSNRLHYSCVSRPVARLAAGLLRQELQIR